MLFSIYGIQCSTQRHLREWRVRCRLLGECWLRMIVPRGWQVWGRESRHEARDGTEEIIRRGDDRTSNFEVQRVSFGKGSDGRGEDGLEKVAVIGQSRYRLSLSTFTAAQTSRSLCTPWAVNTAHGAGIKVKGNSNPIAVQDCTLTWLISPIRYRYRGHVSQ
jgi:hypothetical protein